jgi:cell division protein FtsI/penicillin-binding protein 2
MDAVFNWVLRAVFLVVGLGAGVWVVRWLLANWRAAEERWPLRLALGMLFLCVLYGYGHARMLGNAEQIEAARMHYVKYGDPRLTELRRAEVRGWIMDCSGEQENALALYREKDGVVSRYYPLGQGGANLIGGGSDQVERDFTVERLFVNQLRDPRDLSEAGQLHPAGTDLGLTICREPTDAAWRLLRETRRPGAVVVQDVATGALVAYAATGGPEDAPFGIKRYAPPGSVFKLALSALWWENNLPDNTPIPCPNRLQVTPRASIGNYGDEEFESVEGPKGMLVPSCNTAAIWMAQHMREKLGVQAFVDAYNRFGFETYEEKAPRDTAVSDFWLTDNPRWARRMSPPPNRMRLSSKTGAHEWALLSIGQGPVDVTPIGVSRFIQAIGNGGVMLHPYLEKSVSDERNPGTRVMREGTAQKLLDAMYGVTHEELGTASRSRALLRGFDWDMVGKTGTAEVAGKPDDGWFAGLALGPDGRPRYTLVVYLQGGGPGGRMSAAVAAQMVRVLAEGEVADVPIRSVPGGAE